MSEKSSLVKIGAVWAKKNDNGKYYAGKLGDAVLFLFPSQSDHPQAPDYNVFVGDARDKDEKRGRRRNRDEDEDDSPRRKTGKSKYGRKRRDEDEDEEGEEQDDRDSDEDEDDAPF